MNKLKKLLLAIFLLGHSFVWSDEPQELKLTDEYDLFSGDWLDTWQDPKDERFIDQGIDLRKSFEEATPIREELYNMRQRYIKQFNEMSQLPKADYFQLEKDITSATIDFIVKYLDKAKPANINKSEMAFMGFGSMARGEAGIVTDLEGTLLWDKNVLSKDDGGLVFGQALSNLLDGLIGHPIYGVKGFRLDEANNSPFHRAPWARFMPLSDAFCMAVKSQPRPWLSPALNKFKKSYYYPFEGSWVYTNNTPESLANFTKAGSFDSWPNSERWSGLKKSDLNSDWYEWVKPALSEKFIQEDYIAGILENSACGSKMKRAEIAEIAKNISLTLQSNEIATIGRFPLLSRNRVFVYGNRELFYKFEDARNKILNAFDKQLRRQLAFKYLNELVDYISDPTVGIVRGKAPDVIDIKRYNYRFEEQLYTDLAFLLDLELQNQGDIIRYLTENGILGQKFGLESFERVNQIIRLRLKKQIALQSQLPRNMQFLTVKAHAKKLKEIKDEIRKNQKIIAKSHDKMKKLAAKTEITDLKADLNLMSKLIPGNSDSILAPSDIAYIKDKLFPEQADVLKRLKNFLKANNMNSKKYDFRAFQD